jgi:hypothetical protein
MAIEIKEMVIKTSVDSSNNAASGEKALCDDLKKIRKEILKESMENVIEYLNRQKER